MILELLALKELNKPVIIPQPKPTQTIKVEPKKESKKPKLYTIKQGDTLTKVSKRFKAPLRRVLCANPKILDPDHIEAGEVLKIPKKKDKLKCPKIKSQGKRIPGKIGHSIAPSGNTYEAGQCTWHVKNNVSWVGNGWGDASSWSYNAGLDGYGTHSTPKAGAVAWRSGHVGYVLDVKAGQVLISEMNYDWTPYHQREVWVDVSAYKYIY